MELIFLTKSVTKYMSFDIDVDVTIFLGFLTLNLILGLLSSRGIRTIKSYAVGDGDFSTATIVSTIVATWVSGEFFVTIAAETYNAGLIFILIVFADVLSYLFIGLYFAPRMREFIGKLSIAEAMGDLYGDKVRIITAIFGFIAVSGIIAIQLQIAGVLFEHALDIPVVYGILLVGIIITLYSALGGIKSVAFTDVMQFCTFGVIIPAITYFILSNINSAQTIENTISTSPLFDYKSVLSFSNPQIYYYTSLFLWLLIPGFDPAIFQRISMSKDTKQAGTAFIIASIIGLFIAALVCWIGILLLSAYPSIEGDDILKLMISDYGWITGFKGLILAGIMAMVMSTVDSYINSSSVLLVHDLRATLNIGFIKNELFATRICSVIIGTIAIIFAMRGGNFFELILWTSTCYMPIVTTPFIMSVFGFRSSNNSVLAGMAGGFVTVVVWELFLKESMGNVGGLVPGMLANLICLVGYHYLFKQSGGWVGIKDPTPLIELKQERRERWKKLYNSILEFNLVSVLKKNTPSGDGLISLLGFFVMISTFSSVVSIPKIIQAEHKFLLNIIYPATLILSSGLISYPLWLKQWKESNLLSILWNLIVFFVLVSFSALMVLISNFSEIQLMVFMVNIVVISSLCSWRWSLLSIVLGVSSILLIYKTFLAQYQPIGVFSTSEFKIMYLLLLVSSTLIIFLKPKQEYLEATEERVTELETETAALRRENGHAKREILNMAEGVEYFHAQLSKQKEESSAKTKKLASTIRELKNELLQVDNLKDEFLRNLQHESNTPLTAVISKSNILFDSYDSLDSDTIKASIKDIINGSERLQSYVSNLVDTSKLTENAGSKLDKVIRVNLSKLVEERTKSFKKVFSDDKHKPRFKLDIEADLMVECNEHYITQLLDNLISNADKYGENSVIEISLSKMNSIMVEFKITDHGIGIPKDEVYDIFKIFTNSSRTHSQAEGRGLGLALCKKVVEAHQGRIIAESDGEKGATFTFVIPFNYHFKGVKI